MMEPDILHHVLLGEARMFYDHVVVNALMYYFFLAIAGANTLLILLSTHQHRLRNSFAAAREGGEDESKDWRRVSPD